MEILGEALAGANRLDEAFEALRMAMTGNEKPDLLLLLGEVQLRRGRMADARQAFARLVTVDMGNDRGWASLGLLQARNGDVAAARDSLEKALRLNPTLVEAQVVRAQIALLDSQPVVALQRMQQAQQGKPDDPWVLGWLGFAYLANGNPTAAAERLQAAVNGSLTGFAPVLAEALRRLGKPEQAIAALDLWKTDEPRVAMLRARCLLDLNRIGEAEARLKAQLTLSPDSAELHYLLGLALHTGGQYSAAVAELDQATKLQPTSAQAANGLAVARATEAAEKLMNAAVVPPPPAPAK
jgi:Flp pilus assembly protein TadD